MIDFDSFCPTPLCELRILTFLRCFSNFKPLKVTLASTAYINITITKKSINLKTNSFHKRITITGFNNGEDIRKEIDGPKGAPELNKPANIGIVEQEQKGVSAPNNVPEIYPVALLPFCKIPFIFSSVTTCCNKLTIKLITINRAINSKKSRIKFFKNSII